MSPHNKSHRLKNGVIVEYGQGPDGKWVATRFTMPDRWDEIRAGVFIGLPVQIVDGQLQPIWGDRILKPFDTEKELLDLAKAKFEGIDLQGYVN
jgi:hypothetical protein